MDTNAPAPPVDPYTEAVRCGWTDFFAALPAQAQILDVGIGNHVAALIATSAAAMRGADWSIHAIDAQPAQPPFLPHPIHFHSATERGVLPFEDGRFDAVCGHHTLELGDARGAFPETLRVLRQGGESQFLLHHSDSPMVFAALQSLAEGDLVLSTGKVFRKLKRLVAMEQMQPGATDRASEDVRSAIHFLKASLPDAQARGGGDVLVMALHATQQLLALRRDGDANAAVLAVEREEQRLRTMLRDMQQVAGSASDEARIGQIVEDARAAGFRGVESAPLMMDRARPIAWQLLMQRG